ncbi:MULTISPECIES: hypothetical protein [Shouchella]|uniref:Uncharacterized protein n=2 Tax=Shouchella TaxID=2893057 RepID=A0ABY7WB19_9BACI|nr:MULTISPECIES: hypothetical protein [Shouchella]MED4127432.1 hypothetical protein [Shouchella miscanthi]WDF03900.1 hypothetical protein PQ477_20820 [Shouchella hunanensis]GAF24280.1 hypothetical protein JCM19047_4158 [Bacillus sp. JCM 19047]
MKQVLPSFHSFEPENRLSVLRLEIDYQLMTLYDALVAEDSDKINDSKALLDEYRQEWLSLQK